MLKLYMGKIHDIDLDRPAGERWKEFAQKEAGAISALLHDAETCVTEELEPYLGSTLCTALHALASGAGRLLRRIVNQFGEDYTRELACIAQHADVPVGKLMLGNLIYDLTSLSEMYGCGCSSLSFEVENTPVLARNMDWVMPRSTGRHTKLMRFHRGRSSYTAVGVAGVVGVLSAMSDSWAVTVNQAPVVNTLNPWLGWLTAPALLTKWPALQRVRAVCDQLPSYNGLVLGLRSHESIVPFFAHVVGTQTKEHTVVTHVGDTSKIRTKRHCMAQTNHYVSGEYAQYNPEDGDGWEWNTYPRYDTLKAVLRDSLTDERKETIAQRPVTALQLLKGVTDEDTMQQMVLWPAKGQMAVKTRNSG